MFCLLTIGHSCALNLNPQTANASFASRALRVLATCARPLTAAEADALADDALADDADARLAAILGTAGGGAHRLCFLGMFGLRDPPREGVAGAVATCQAAGVRVVMITGDQIDTAVAISKNLGILDDGKDEGGGGGGDDGGKEATGESEDEPLLGGDLEAAAGPVARTCAGLHTDPRDPAGSPHVPAPELDAATATTNTFARAQPLDKIAIVDSLRRQGQVTVMTGDGVNDAAALKAADIGVSMGIAGTDVAKSASDMILTDDNFVSIVRAVEEGRRIFGNLQKYVLYYLGTKAAELVMFSICTFGNIFAPVAGIRGLLAAVPLTFSTPLTLLMQPAEPYQMTLPPRPASGQARMNCELHCWCRRPKYGDASVCVGLCLLTIGQMRVFVLPLGRCSRRACGSSACCPWYSTTSWP